MFTNYESRSLQGLFFTLGPTDTSPTPRCPRPGSMFSSSVLPHRESISYCGRLHPESRVHFLERNFILFPEKAKDVN